MKGAAMPDFGKSIGWQLAVGLGKADNIKSMRRFGYNPTMSTGVLEDLWELGSTYPFLTAAAPLYINASSTGLSGSLSFELRGLDADWNLQTATANLSTADTSAQNVIGSTATTWIRVYNLKNTSSVNSTATVYCATASTSLSTAGAPPTNVTRAVILPNFNHSALGLHSVRAAHRGFIDSVRASLSRAGGAAGNLREMNLHIYTREFGGVFQLNSIGGYSVAGSVNESQFDFWRALPAKTDILLRTQTVHANSAAQSGITTHEIRDE
jgi:hypothetical protein